MIANTLAYNPILCTEVRGTVKEWGLNHDPLQREAEELDFWVMIRSTLEQQESPRYQNVNA